MVLIFHWLFWSIHHIQTNPLHTKINQTKIHLARIQLRIHNKKTLQIPFQSLFRSTEPFQWVSLKNQIHFFNSWVIFTCYKWTKFFHVPYVVPSPRRFVDRVAILLIQTTSTWKTRHSRCHLELRVAGQRVAQLGVSDMGPWLGKYCVYIYIYT